MEARLVIAKTDEAECEAGQQSISTPGQSPPKAGFGGFDGHDSDEDDDVATSDDNSDEASRHSFGSEARQPLDYPCELEGHFFS